jgi:Fur family transcriptional regulator, ferric uptake regulator
MHMPTLPARDTRQRRAIREVFEQASRPLSTDEVLESAQEAIAGLGIATVYRSIRSLVDDGFLAVVDVPGRVPLYELAGKAHHHHFACTACERVYELDGCTTEVKGSLPRGFRATGHDVTIYGICQACGSEQRSGQRARRKKR